MNWTIIAIGVALVMALTAAVVGPYFIDWTAYRATIEENASRILGTDVAIDGDAEVRLLPRPRVKFTNVRIGAADAPLIEAESVELDVDLTPLLKREVHILDMRLIRPTVYLRVSDAGRLAVPDITRPRRLGSYFDVDRVMVEDIAVEDMRAVLSDARSGHTRTLEHVSLTGSARSLRGPFNASGAAVVRGTPVALRIAGGAPEADGSMALSIRATPEDEDMSLGFDGTLVPAPDAPSLTGRLTAESTAGPRWSARGEMTLDPTALRVERGVVSWGDAPAPLELAASARYALTGADPLEVALEARQVDLDRIDRAITGAPLPAIPVPAAEAAAAAPLAPPAEAIGRLATHLAPVAHSLWGAGGHGVDARVTLDIGTVVAGGALIRDVTAALRTSISGVALERAEALLPGDTTLDADGRISAAGFSGHVKASAAQPAALARWWTGAPSTGRTVAPIILEADVETSAAGLDAPRLALRIGDTAISGRARLAADGGDGAPALEIGLSAPLLDMADVRSGAGLVAEAGGLPDLGGANVTVDLAVDRLRAGRVEGSSLTVDADFKGDTLTIDAFAAEDIAGAQVFASGSIGDLYNEPVGVIDGTLLLNDGASLAAGLREVFPDSALAEALAARMPALAPGDVRLSLSGRPTGASADLSVRLSGTLGGSDVALSLTGALQADLLSQPLSLSLEAANREGTVLARQVGLSTPDAGHDAGPDAATDTTTDTSATEGPATLHLRASGIPRDGLDTTASAEAAGAALRYSGTIGYDDRPFATGDLEANAESLDRLAALLGQPLPSASAIRLKAHAESRDDGLALTDLRGSVDGVSVSGELVAGAGQVHGSLAIGEVDVAALARLALGTDLAAGADAPWSTSAFGAPLLPPLPASLDVTTPTLRLGATLVRDASFTLALGPDRLTLGEVGGRLGDGLAAGDLAIRREEGRARVSASLALDGVSLGDFAWRTDSRPIATGRLDLEARAEAEGYTLAGLIAGLSGTGEIETDATMRLSPTPFDIGDALTAADAMDADALAAAVASHLADGTTATPLATPIEISAGAASVREIALGTALPSAPVGPPTLSATADLAAWRLTGSLTVPVAAPEGRSPPAVTVTFAGPLDAPQRHIDAAALAAWLSLARLERQVDEVEAQNEELAAEADALNPPLPGDEPAREPGAATPEATTPTPQEPEVGEPEVGEPEVAAPGATPSAVPVPPHAPDERSELAPPADAGQTAAAAPEHDAIGDLLRRTSPAPAPFRVRRTEAPAPFRMREGDRAAEAPAQP